MKQTKIEASEYREFIETELLAGASYRGLSKELKEMGFQISHGALSEYHKLKLGGRKSGAGATEESNLLAVSDNELSNRKLLETIFRNQLLIVDQRTREYMAGEAPFPDNEVRALVAIDGILKSNNVRRVEVDL